MMKNTHQFAKLFILSLSTLFLISSCSLQEPAERKTQNEEEPSTPVQNTLSVSDLGYSDSFDEFKPITLAQLEHFLKKEFDLGKATNFEHSILYNEKEDYHFLRSTSSSISIGIKLVVKEMKDGSFQASLEPETCICTGMCQEGCKVESMCGCSACSDDSECTKTHTIKDQKYNLSDFIAP